MSSRPLFLLPLCFVSALALNAYAALDPTGVYQDYLEKLDAATPPVAAMATAAARWWLTALPGRCSGACRRLRCCASQRLFRASPGSLCRGCCPWRPACGLAPWESGGCGWGVGTVACVPMGDRADAWICPWLTRPFH